MEARRQSEEASQRFWKAFSKAAAAASLATLVTPATAEFAPVLRGAAAVADLVLLAHAIYSVSAQLSQLNELLTEQLIGPDAFALESLSRLGELGAFRTQLLNSLGEQVLLQLVLIAASARWTPVRKLLIASGYLLDLDTLLSDR